MNNNLTTPSSSRQSSRNARSSRSSQGQAVSQQALQALQEIQWNEDGLVPAIVQCHKTKQVLMFAWMNSESLSLTIQQQRTVFWSRSRNQLWFKGETSGAVQPIKELWLDCDGDCILIQVDQQGSGACHLGKPSCFFRQYQQKEGWQ